MSDKKHGYGKYYWPDGKIFEGTWVNGKREGQGMITFTNGESKVGEWKNDQRIRWVENEKKYDNMLRTSGPEFRDSK